MWCALIRQDESRQWLIETARSLKASEFYASCKMRTTDFSVGVFTQDGFQEAAASVNFAKMDKLFEQWLTKRLIKMQNSSWKEGLDSGVIPLWSQAHGGEFVSGNGMSKFDCIIVEPFLIVPKNIGSV